MSLFDQFVSAEVDIAAPIEQVWDILVDLEQYQAWNPFTYRVESSLNVGDHVKLYVKLGGQKVVQKQVIRRCEAPDALDWGMVMGHPSLLKTLRTQRLTRIDDTTTRYETRDHFTGLLTPLILSFYRHPIRKGFETICSSLKQRCTAAL